MNRNLLLLTALGATFTVGELPARADWLHYRGPTQNGVSPETGWNAQLADSPKVLWKAQVGTGMSSVVTKGDRAYTMGNVDGNDVVVCLNAANGQEVWRHAYPMSVDPNMFEGGPRSTPVLDEGYIYFVGHEGDLWCLEAATGKKVWYKHYQQDFKGERPSWGYAGSPLVHGNLLICDVGGAQGSTVALDKRTGKTVWAAGADKGGYASPVAARLGGREAVLIFKAEALVAYDPANGREQWRYPWKTSYDVNAATPLLLPGDRVFISSGYNTGCTLLQVKGGQVSALWTNKNLRSQINSPTVVGNTIFGVDGNTGGNLTALAVDTGEKQWQEKTVKGAALIASDGKLIVLTEKGELVVAEATGAGFKPLSRRQVLDKRCWAQPKLDGGRLYVKDNFGELLCLAAK